MFGLTKREQRWKAEKEAALALVELARVSLEATAQVEVARAAADEGRLHKRIAELEADNASLRDQNAQLDANRANLEAQLVSGQEPVAWFDEEFHAAYTPKELDGGATKGLVPLYAHPAPPQQPLTRSALRAIIESAPMPSDPGAVGRWVLNVIRAVEAAYGIRKKP
jgi:hypothetical protein